MKFIIAFQLALRSLRLNIVRTSLTVLGVVIGAASIVIVFSASQALNSIIQNELNSYGGDIVQTEVKVPSKKTSLSTSGVTTLKDGDLLEINKIKNINESYAASIGQQKVSYGSEGKMTMIFGVSPSYIRIDKKSTIASGRFFENDENESESTVIVLGSKLKETIFGDQEAIGKMVKVGNSNYRVVGVMTEQGSSGGFLDFDNMAYLPVKTLHKRILGIDHYMYFIHQIKDESQSYATAEEIRAILRDRHEIIDLEKEDFRVSTMDEIIKTLSVVTDAVTYLLLAIVLLSLLVGGVGIMNIMYVTVTERTPEIGLRKALGATRGDITWQFLIESVLITFWGWFLGVVIGIIGSYLLIVLGNSLGLKIFFAFPWRGIIVSFVFSIACGLLFGFQPAKRAAKLDPVEALRTE